MCVGSERAWHATPTCNAVFFTSSASWNIRIISSILSMCTYSPTNAGRGPLPAAPSLTPPLLADTRPPPTLKSCPLLPSALVLGSTYVGNDGPRRAWRGLWLLLLPPRGVACGPSGCEGNSGASPLGLVGEVGSPSLLTALPIALFFWSRSSQSLESGPYVSEGPLHSAERRAAHTGDGFQN